MSRLPGGHTGRIRRDLCDNTTKKVVRLYECESSNDLEKNGIVTVLLRILPFSLIANPMAVLWSARTTPWPGQFTFVTELIVELSSPCLFLFTSLARTATMRVRALVQWVACVNLTRHENGNTTLARDEGQEV